MRTDDRSKRAMAVTAAIVDTYAAQLQSEADNRCVTQEEAADLQAASQLARDVATRLFSRSLPAKRAR